MEETVCTSAIKSIKYLIQNFRRTKQSLCGEILEHPERYKSRTKKKKENTVQQVATTAVSVLTKALAQHGFTPAPGPGAGFRAPPRNGMWWQ